MFLYEKKLQYPVRIKNPNPKLAAFIISQYGGPDGELGASLRYLSQRYAMPYPELKGLLTDIGTEELGHLEMIGAIVHQLTRGLDDEQVREYMGQLNQTGRYEVSPAIQDRLTRLFSAGFCDDAQTQKVIGRMWQEHHYLIDPHTAVAFDVLEQYRKETGDDTPAIVASTASPFKFCDSVLGALGVTELAEGTAILDQLSELTGVPVPAPLAALKDKPVRFRETVTRDHMVDQVLEMLR